MYVRYLFSFIREMFIHFSRIFATNIFKIISLILNGNICYGHTHIYRRDFFPTNNIELFLISIVTYVVRTQMSIEDTILN